MAEQNQQAQKIQLNPCIVCGNGVAPNAAFCPHCGCVYSTGFLTVKVEEVRVVRDLDISFTSMIWLALKAIPALLVVCLILSCVGGFAMRYLYGFFAGAPGH